MFGWFKWKPKQVPTPEPVAPEPAPVPPTPKFFGPNRVEEIVFSFSASYPKVQEHRAAIVAIDPEAARSLQYVGPLDTLQFSYRIIIEYFGNVVRSLGHIQQIAEDPDLFVKVDISELQHGRSVILDALRALDDAIARIQAQESMKDDEP